MVRILRVTGLVLVSVWLAWNLYRHVAVYIVRGRVLAVTDRVLGNLVGAAGLVVVLAAPSWPTVAVAGLCVAVATAIRGGQLWAVVGATPERIVERAGLVLRGMGLPHDATGRGSLEERGGRIRISVVVSLTARTHLLRLRAARGIRKIALFLANLRKFLLAIRRDGR